MKNYFAIKNQLGISLRDKLSFLADINSILVNRHLKLSWFTEFLKLPQTKYGEWSSFTVSNDTASLDGYHPHCENLNLILKTGRNSSRIYGWVAWGEEALKPKKRVLKEKLWVVAPACLVAENMVASTRGLRDANQAAHLTDTM